MLVHNALLVAKKKQTVSKSEAYETNIKYELSLLHKVQDLIHHNKLYPKFV